MEIEKGSQNNHQSGNQRGLSKRTQPRCKGARRHNEDDARTLNNADVGSKMLPPAGCRQNSIT